jgi:hypothetical protein
MAWCSYFVPDSLWAGMVSRDRIANFAPNAPLLACPAAKPMHPTLNIAIKAARRAGQIINRASMDVDKLGSM